jgi:hypothetical protein
MSQTYIRSDAVTVSSLRLTASNGKAFNISDQVAQFSIYEDVMFPVIRAEFVIFDGVDYLNTIPIIGEEDLEVEFSNPGFESTQFKFKVKSIENTMIMPQGKMKTYVLRAVSEEMFINNTRYITRKYTTEAWNVVMDIISNDLGTNKPFGVGDETKGVQDILISRLRPLQAIDMIRRRSVSLDNQSSSYVFFENKRGFNFASLEFLLTNQENVIKDKIFFYDTAGNSDARNLTTRSMLSLYNVSQVNNTKKMIYGGLNNIVKKFDLFTGETSETLYVNSQDQQKFKFASKNPRPLNTNKFEQEYGQAASLSMLVPYSSHLPETYIAESLGLKNSFVTKISQNIYHAYVNGDTVLTAGDVITVKVPTIVGTGEATENRLLAGNYLISKLRHIVINASSAQKTYHCSMELIKGTYEDYA